MSFLHQPVRILLVAFSVIIAGNSFCQQTQFSIATDLGVQRSFRKEQRFWAVGHTTHTHFHFTPKDGLYAWIGYYSNGTFQNLVTATAKSPATIPSQITYHNTAVMRFKHFSIGWKKYLKGAYNSESWNIYGYAGFGILLGRVDNRHSNPIDTSIYNAPVLVGEAKFKRLTLDLGLGWETHIGGGTYTYIEGRAWVPASDYPSKHIFVNNNAPLVGMLNLGVRILFD
jgi:hypothetical protein